MKGWLLTEVMGEGRMILINQIFQCLTMTDRCIMQLRQQNLHAGLRGIRELSGEIMSLIENLMRNMEYLSNLGYVLDMQSVTAILQGIMQAQESADYVLLADLLELQLKPFLLGCQEILVSNEMPEEKWFDKNMDRLKKKDAILAGRLECCEVSDDYAIEYTSSGALTMRITDATGTYYLHSNVNPVSEGQIFAERYYDENNNRYVVYGLGLGYHIQELCRLDDGIYIDIIEPDIEIIKKAFSVMDMSWLMENDRLHLIWDEDFQILKKCLKAGEMLLIHYPSLRHIQNESVKLSLEKYFIHDSGIRNFSIQLVNNFRDNIENCKHYVDELQEQFFGKNAVIVAAGPSLDKNVMLLKQRPANTVVVAVGTVFRKLVHLGIRPDFVIFLDAQPHLYRQIEGLEQETIPIICASTACKKIAAAYQGEKYLICQKGYDRAEQYAKERGCQLYDTGGSVSTIALDLCLKMGCHNVAFIGLDLAFTDNRTHAEDTADLAAEDGENREWVTAADGGVLPASKLFIIYREWIERKAESAGTSACVIDATEGGALKRGLKKLTLREVFAEWM